LLLEEESHWRAVRSDDPGDRFKIPTNRPLKLINWNVWWRAGDEKLIPRLLSDDFDCDFLMLQEVVVRTRFLEEHSTITGNTIPYQIALHRLMSFMFIETRRRETKRYGTISEGSILYSKYSIEFGYIVLSQGGRALGKNGLGSRRVLVYGTVTTESGQKVTFANVHLSYRLPLRTNATLIDNESATLLSWLSEHPHPVFLAGDFNAKNSTRIIKSLSNVLNPLGPEMSAPTWIGPRFVPNMLGRRIDFAFASNYIQVISSGILDSGPSDHRPLVYELHI